MSDKIKVDMTLIQRLVLLDQLQSNEIGGADTIMRIKRISKCFGLKKSSQSPRGRTFFEPTDPGEVSRTGFEVIKNGQGQAMDLTVDPDRDKPVRVKLTTADHAWLKDRISTYEVPVANQSWESVLDLFELLDEEELEEVEGPESIQD